MSLMVQGQLHSAVDERLKAKGGYTIEEGERLLHLGLLCSHTDPSIRPTMRQVVKILEVEIDSIESDEDNMEMSLLGKIRSATTWSRVECALPYSGYPSFDEVKMFSFNSRTSRSGSSTFPGSESEITSINIKSEAQIKHHGFHQVQCTNLDQTLNETDNVAQDDTPLMKDGSRLFPKVVHSLPASQLHQRAPHKPH
ncbi:hypothetical protein JHK84_047827 [Glycine max]|nr:hypothetical protein JHK84_047827 [Glycine max]